MVAGALGGWPTRGMGKAHSRMRNGLAADRLRHAPWWRSNHRPPAAPSPTHPAAPAAWCQPSACSPRAVRGGSPQHMGIEGRILAEHRGGCGDLPEGPGPEGAVVEIAMLARRRIAG